eukprot:COSAG01_NODE_73959_length_232_cov_6.759398_1_plen_36_part_10
MGAYIQLRSTIITSPSNMLGLVMSLCLYLGRGTVTS